MDYSEKIRLLRGSIPGPPGAGGQEGPGRLLDETLEALAKYSRSMSGEIFLKAAGDVLEGGDYSFFADWLEITREMARLPWEILWAWLQFSPRAGGAVRGEAFRSWGRLCLLLHRYSSDACLRTVRGSPGILDGVREAGEEDKLLLIRGCLDLAGVSWPASVEFFNCLPGLCRRLKTGEILAWHREGLDISRMDTRVGKSYFASAGMWDHCAFGLFADWAGLGKGLAAKSPAAAVAYFDSVPEIIGAAGEVFFRSIFKSWGKWAQKLLAIDSEVAAAFLKESGKVIPVIRGEGLDIWADSVADLSRRSRKAALALASAGEAIFGELKIDQYRGWYRQVLAEKTGESICEAVSLKTRESRRRLLSFRRGVALDGVARTLEHFALAFFAKEINIKSTAVLPEELVSFRDTATCDGKRVYLPGFIGEYPEEAENLSLYKRLLIHEAAHLLEGTYRIERQTLMKLAGEFNLSPAGAEVRDINEYLAQFENYSLITDIFELIEDSRVEKALLAKYPGLAKEMGPGDPECPDGTGEAGRDSLAGAVEVMAGICRGVRGEATDSAEYGKFAASFQAFINSGPDAAGSLRLATIWYLGIKDREADILAYIPRGAVRGRGKIHPVLESVSGMVEGEYRQSGILNVNYLAGRIRIRHPAVNDDNRKSVTGHMAGLLAGFIREEEDSSRPVADYDEWDFTLSGYKPDWARVREFVLKPSSASFVQDTLKQYYGLVASLKRYFALLRPDRFRRYRRQEDGDQEDLDAVVEAWVDKKTGAAPPGGLYIRRDKRVRDVAVAFLLDLSDSTSQRLDSNKTILDVEKESVVIMSEALEVLGDRYAIYGFSSEGREMVSFYIIKEFSDRYTPEIKQRFGGIRSGGQTRVGAAVRHAARKLERVEASIRVLMLLSDGRPYDIDYCAQFGPGDIASWMRHDDLLYALEDTRMAIGEAKARMITPFCITVDRKGKEYLEKILGNTGYVVIDNVDLLPVKLPEIYKKLTV